MRFDKFVSYYKRKEFNKNFHNNYHLKTSSKPFYVCKESNTTAIEK